MALFRKTIKFNRFLHHAIAATFTGGVPIVPVDPAHWPTAGIR
jgi:hypothetical protein